MCWWWCTHNNNLDIPQPKTLDERRYLYHADSPYSSVQYQQNEPWQLGGAYKASRYELCKSNMEAKRQYRLKLELMFDNSDSRRMWQGLQTITDYKGKSSCVVPTKASLPEELNIFYARFEADNTESSRKTRCSRRPGAFALRGWREKLSKEHPWPCLQCLLTSWRACSRTSSTCPCPKL